MGKITLPVYSVGLFVLSLLGILVRVWYETPSYREEPVKVEVR